MKAAANENVDWKRASYKPVALLILPWAKGGCTMVHRDKAGTLHGCRDVSNKLPTDYAVCAAAWINDAKQRGLSVEDHANVFAAIQAVSNELMAAVLS